MLTGMPVARADQPRFTYADYQRWSGDERWELVGGEPIAMSPAPDRRHQALLVELAFQIRGQLEGHRCRVFVAPFDVRLAPPGVADEAVTDVVQPDIVVVCDQAKLDERGCHGAPDWIVEISSPSTAARDRIVKRELYARHGVGEYWIVDPEDRQLTRYRRLPSGGFDSGSQELAAATTAVGAVPGLTIDWDRAFAGL